MTARSHSAPLSPSALIRWLPWLFGGAVVVALVSVSAHMAEARDFADLARRAHPGWMLAAGLVQFGTYLAEARAWLVISCHARCPLTFRRAIALTFAKTFVDHALPTAGVGGSAIAASALKRLGVSPPTIAASIVAERATFLAAYVVALLGAVAIGLHGRHVNGLVTMAAALFAIGAAVAALALVAFTGRRLDAPRWMRRFGPTNGILRIMRRADPAIVRNPALLMRATALQLLVIALDTATMIAVVYALGAHVSFSGVYVSFMLSSLFRTIGVSPGGLGTFEASSVLTLRMAGASLPVAVSATLLFRGFSYWLPMLPGAWFARHDFKRRRSAPAIGRAPA